MMPSDKSADVKINFGPEVPKDDPGMFALLIKASDDVARHGLAYLGSGDINDARRMLNAQMKLKTLAAKQQLPQMESRVVGGYPALDDARDERQQAMDALNEMADKA